MEEKENEKILIQLKEIRGGMESLSQLVMVLVSLMSDDIDTTEDENNILSRPDIEIKNPFDNYKFRGYFG